MKICVGKITQPARNMAQYRGACQQGGMLLLVPTQQGPRGRKMVGVRVSQSERQTERDIFLFSHTLPNNAHLARWTNKEIEQHRSWCRSNSGLSIVQPHKRYSCQSSIIIFCLHHFAIKPDKGWSSDAPSHLSGVDVV